MGPHPARIDSPIVFWRHAGVWESDQPGQVSRRVRLAAAVDSDIRRAGRADASPLATRASQYTQVPLAGGTVAPGTGLTEVPEASTSHELHALRAEVGRTLTRHMSASGRAAAPAIVQRFLSNKTRMQRAANSLGTAANSAMTRGAAPARHIMQQSVYGRSVPELVDEVVSPSAQAGDSDVTEEGLAQRQHKLQRSLQRVTLKDVPANALVPPAAAAATTALATAPGGSAALCALQRGAVTQALQEAGVQLGVLVCSSNNAHNESTGEGRSPVDIHAISQQSRVALDILLLDVCKTLGCKNIPLLYVRPDTVARAHFLALPKESLEDSSELQLCISWSLHPTFVITSAVLELLDREELRALLGSLLAFSMAPGGCGFDASAAQSVAELSSPVLDAFGAVINPCATPESHFDRRSSRGSVHSRRTSTSPSRMHAAAPRLSTTLAGHSQGLQTATLAAAATAVALQDLTPGLLSVIGIGREERDWKARVGWGGGGLEAMTRRAAPLLRMAADRGAMLVAQVPPPAETLLGRARQKHFGPPPVSVCHVPSKYTFFCCT